MIFVPSIRIYLIIDLHREYFHTVASVLLYSLCYPDGSFTAYYQIYERWGRNFAESIVLNIIRVSKINRDWESRSKFNKLIVGSVNSLIVDMLTRQSWRRASIISQILIFFDMCD